jgi:hypothetical protein
MPGSWVPDENTPSRRRADRAEFHPVGFLVKSRDLLAGVLGTWNLSGGSILASEVGHQKIATHVRTREIPNSHEPSRIPKSARCCTVAIVCRRGVSAYFSAVTNVTVERLIVNGTGQAEVPASATTDVVRGFEDCLEYRSDCG